MRRGTITGTLLGAVVVGVAGGVLLHGAAAFPISTAPLVSGAQTAGPSGDGSTGPSSEPKPSENKDPAPSAGADPTTGENPDPPEQADPTQKADPPQKDDPTPKPDAPTTSKPPKSSEPEPSSSTTAPAFTRAALLVDQDFLDRGWGKAEVLSLSDGVPEPAVTLCASVSGDADGLRSAYAATYRGLQTDGAEQVARFRTESAAEDAFAKLTAQVDDCDSSPADGSRASVLTQHNPALKPLDQVTWWSTGPAEGGVSARGMVGIVRIDDRIACLTLTSETSDPVATVEIESLLTQAGRRLV